MTPTTTATLRALLDEMEPLDLFDGRLATPDWLAEAFDPSSCHSRRRMKPA